MAGVLDDNAGSARMFFFPFGHNHGRAFFDGLPDEVMAVAFFATHCHEQAIPLYTARVIRDAFHRAIRWPDDFANGNRSEKRFELHEVSACGCQALNGAEHWLRQLAPLEWLCELPHAVRDRDRDRKSTRLN